MCGDPQAHGAFSPWNSLHTAIGSPDVQTSNTEGILGSSETRDVGSSTTLNVRRPVAFQANVELGRTTFGVTMRDSGDVQHTSELLCSRARETGEECSAAMPASVTNHLSAAMSQATAMNAAAIAFHQVQRAWELLELARQFGGSACQTDFAEVKLQFMHAWSVFPSSGLIIREMTAVLIWPTVICNGWSNGMWKYHHLHDSQDVWEGQEICSAI